MKLNYKVWVIILVSILLAGCIGFGIYQYNHQSEPVPIVKVIEIPEESSEIILETEEESIIVELPQEEKKVEEKQNSFQGSITHYGPDCAGCSGITASGYDVKNTVYYNDSE